jgi:putative methyltransferase (TIGR04325 family)
LQEILRLDAMSNSITSIAKLLVPPVFQKAYHFAVTKYGFFGDYKSWTEASQNSMGYDASVILDKVKESLLEVKNGTAVYARDAVIFNEVFYPYPLLAGLLKIAISCDGKLNLLDFGGSLGTSYYQCKNFLSGIQCIQWSIVEQKQFVECGQKFFEDDILAFFYEIQDCIEARNPNVILLSGVIQCLESPYDFLENLLLYDFDYILFDRTAFSVTGTDRLTIQKVPPDIYPASYPSWFLDINKFKDIFSTKYDLLFEFDSQDSANIPSFFKGFCFQSKACL